MPWISLIAAAIILWAASLIKILQNSSSPSRVPFVDDVNSSTRKNVLLLTAHPDDESMFFVPVINYLISKGHNLHVLCMSTGNAGGLGKVRRDEFYSAAAVLKISSRRVKIVEHPDLQDGFGKIWNPDHLASIIDHEIRLHAIDLMITFDDYGVSGHCNHRDLHRGVRKLLQNNPGRNIEAWELVSRSILRKYIGPVDIWLSSLSLDGGKQSLIPNVDPVKTYAAMAQHSSQWVWYRKLFVAFSSYTYCNTLKRIE
ncbi:hypothetical protein M569_02171, partial [Genlisea aurea]